MGLTNDSHREYPKEEPVQDHRHKLPVLLGLVVLYFLLGEGCNVSDTLDGSVELRTSLPGGQTEGGRGGGLGGAGGGRDKGRHQVA